MDKLLPDDIQYYIAASRIRTARRRKRAVKTEYDKQLLQLSREEDALWDAYRNRGYVPLEPPVQKGYIRTFRMRDDVARGKHSLFFQGILDKINTADYFHRKDFKVKKRSRGRKIYVLKPQHLQEMRLHEFKKKQFTDREKVYFEQREVMCKNGKDSYIKMVFKEPWRFVLQISPYMLTHRRKEDPDLASQIDQLRNYINRNMMRNRMRWLTQSRHSGWRKWLSVEKARYKYPKRTLLQLLQDEYYNIE